MQDDTAIDWSVLETLREIDETGTLLDQVIQSVLHDLKQRVESIRCTAKEGENEQLRLAAHALKSCLATAGAMQLAALLCDIEDAAVVDDRGTIRDRIVRLGIAMPTVVSKLEAIRSSTTTAS